MPTLHLRARRIARSYALRAAISIGLLAVVLSRVDLAEIGRRIVNGNWWLFALAVGVLVAALLLGGLRWHLFLVAAGVPTSRRVAVKAFLSGAFAANFLPTAVGGDLVRGWVGAKAGYRARAYASVVADRVSVVACAFVLAWGAVLLADDVPEASVRTLVTATVALVIAVSFAQLLLAGSTPATCKRLIPRRLVPAARDLRGGLRASLAPRVLAFTTLTGLGYQLLVLTTTWLVAQAVDVDLAFMTLAIVLPSVLVLSAIPVSIGGLGVRELAFVALLDPFGVSATDATLVALMAGATYALATAPGAVTLLVRRRAGPDGAAPESEVAALDRLSDG